MADNEHQVQFPSRDEPVRRTLPAVTARYSLVAAVVGIASAIAHLAWSLTGPPAFVRTESVVGPVWLGAIPAGLAALGYFFLQAPRRSTRTLAVCATSLGCAALAAYCLLLWPHLAQLLTVPFGEPISGRELGATVLEAIGTASALGMATAVVPVARSLRHACLECGRNHAAPDNAEAWRRGRVGAYFALTCFVIRMIPAVREWIAGRGLGGPPGFLVFVLLMVAAGTVLPLALIQRWGQYWPRWLGPIAGRPVPRRLLLIPGWTMSIGLCLYFGIGGLTAVLLGKTGGALEILAYTGWGAGLAIACTSYAHRTRPTCSAQLIDRP